MNYQQSRQMMVDGQIRPNGVTDPRIITALAELPREGFVPASWRTRAYAETAIPLEGATGDRRLLSPAAFARLVQSAEIKPQDLVLDVGCGAGYSTAVLARLGAFVIGLEEDDSLANAASSNLAGVEATNAVVVTGPLAGGYASSAPYDVIIVEGAIEVEPTALFTQLKEGGRLAAIVAEGGSSKATVYLKTEQAIGARPVFDAFTPVLPGFRKMTAFAF
jgi:protein-L-isoaspartate(D-aspartate) O-methyltransferase